MISKNPGSTTDERGVLLAESGKAGQRAVLERAVVGA